MKKILLAFLIFTFGNMFAQTTVNSLEALIPYLNDSNVNVKLAPGTYTVTADDVSSGRIGVAGSGDLGNTFNVFLFEGNNSTYDFTEVTINMKTETAQSVGSLDFHEIRTIGNNNIIKNLTLVDDGSVDDRPTFRATNVVMDGRDNRIEDCHFTVKGSYPYGYGDIFGKGGGSVIGHNKRCAALIRGESNMLKDCTFIHRAYGHGIYFQGAVDPIVDGCYVEGEIRSTDEILAEEGTGSPADNVDFRTVMGFNLKDLEGNYYFSCQEDGIRAYNAGATIVDGQFIERGVSGSTITNCTVVKMRAGVTIGWASGSKYVENCTALACEVGYWVGSDTDVVDCKGDASIGALLNEGVARSNSNIELTLLDDHVTPLNGDVTGLYYAGDNHNVTLHDGTTSFLDHFDIVIGGERLAHRFMNGNGSTNLPLNYDANNIDFTNNTPYPIFLGNKSEDIDVETCGSVSNNGSDNSISELNNCGTVTVKPTTPVSSESGTLVTITKRNAIGFNIDGSHNGEDGQNVQIWSANEDNVNQQWIEIDRGDGYYSYQKQGTDYCIDGNGGGASQQNIHLWTCATNNQNQHWQKVATDGGAFKLIKRNAPGYAINGGSAGVNGQNVNLYDSSNSSHNLQWFITPKVTVVHMEKRNATGFAIDGGNGSENGQNLYLWSANQNNENQQWIEIDRGNGYYSYQKMGTDYCIDGNGGGAEGQNVYLWACSDNNQNQHWKKVSTAGGSFRLEKRNSPSYSLDGNRGGENEQNVYLWNSDNNNQNQQWLITPIGSAKSLPSVGVTDDVIVYPNPVVNTATIQGAANTIISIYDISGQQLLVKEIATDNEEIDLSVLPTGIYYGQVVGALSISAIKIVKK